MANDAPGRGEVMRRDAASTAPLPTDKRRLVKTPSRPDAVGDDADLFTPQRRLRRSAEDPALRQAIGVQVATLRQTAGLTQSQACARLGRRKSWLAKIERGQRSLLFSEAVELAGLYDVSLALLWPQRED